MVSIIELQHKYPGGNHQLIYPDFSCAEGSELLLIGPSGSGKSTLLHILGGFLKPTKGEVIINDQALQDMSSSDRNTFRQEHIGIVFQKHHFIRSLSVLENLKYASYFSRARKRENDLLELLNFLDLKQLAHRAVHTLSEGQKQRLSVARALVHEPALLLADEPSSSLDDKNCELVAELLLKAKEEFGSTLIVVSHDHRLMPYFSHKIELSS